MASTSATSASCGDPLLQALRRILLTGPLLIAVSLLVFALTDALPGSAADLRFEKRPQLMAEWRAERGLDDPFLTRWGRYVKGIVTDWDFDRSYLNDQPVGPELGAKLQATFELTLFALVLAILVGLTVGIVSSVWPRTPLDYAGNFVALCGISMPVFWLGMLLIVLFVNVFGFEFSSNRHHPDLDVSEFVTRLYLLESLLRARFDVFASCAKNLLLPALALCTIPMAVITRMTRAAMLEEMGRDYATTARAKGLPRRRVVLKHVLRNALIPITTITGLQFGQLMGGASSRRRSSPGRGSAATS
ncbi:MAG: ABC transporter permease [Planctomycetes bacterium]|nr:ABC transporter permease [Planctomycetota bacterium]